MMVCENIASIFCYFAKVDGAIGTPGPAKRDQPTTEEHESVSASDTTSPRTGPFTGHGLSFVTLTAISLTLAI